MKNPEDINYDIPLELIRVAHNYTEYIGQTRIAINWSDIDNVEEYNQELEEEKLDWKDFKNAPMIYLTINHDQGIRCLMSYNEFIPLWKYYCRYVRLVDNFQTPDFQRNRNKIKQ